MSFSKPKMPVQPSFAQQQAEQEAYAASKKTEAAAAADAANLDTLRGQRASSTRVGGTLIAMEEQAGRGLMKSQRRRAISQEMYGL